MFRQAGVANGTPNAAGVEWAANNTNAQTTGGTGGSATTVSDSKDEDQVLTVVAHYRMSQ
jgi:hypothetical protein